MYGRNDFGVPVVRRGLKVGCPCGFMNNVKKSARSIICSQCQQFLTFMPSDEAEEMLRKADQMRDPKRINELLEKWVESDQMEGHPERQDFLDLWALVQRQTVIIENLMRQNEALRDFVAAPPKKGTL